MISVPSSKAVTKCDCGAQPHKIQQLFCNVSAGATALLLVAFTFAVFAQAPQADPQFEDLAARAAAAREAQNIPLAIDLYQQADQLKPDWAEGWFYLGMLQYSAKHYQPAIDAFNRFVQLQPASVPAQALRGLSEFETGAYDDSLRDLEFAVAHGATSDPRNEPILRFYLAQLLVRAGRFPDAVVQYKFFAARGISDSDLMVGMGLAGMNVASLPKDVPPQDRELYQGAGNAGFAFLQGDSEQARQIFSQLFLRYPTALNLHLFYGYLLFQHDPDLAIDQFHAEVSLAPGNISTHAILAYTLMIVGRYAEAVPEAQQALAGDPGLQMAQLALGRSLVETGDTQRGADLLNQVLKSDPDNLEAHMALAAMYSRAGKREDAYREHQLCLGLIK
jgi:tetratricopeptide (TPR) repeat protein